MSRSESGHNRKERQELLRSGGPFLEEMIGTP